MNRSLLMLLCLTSTGLTADFPEPYDSEQLAGRLLPPEEAAKKFQVPDGFHVSVFAAEPQVRNPIAMTWDTRGRLWVAENFTYSERAKKYDRSLKDRVLIFHDKNGDGVADERIVFYDQAEVLTGIEVGLGGVWLMCPPKLLFIPDRDGDDRPDGEPVTILEGFTIPPENYHNLANGLKWGPDGWLYGRTGASAPGLVRRPDQLPAEALPVAGGIWRYHPKTRVFETLCHGTTNPWGHDWDAHGECFFTNTVNGHLWHLIPGAHLRRPHTISPNPYVYESLDMIADHWHYDTGLTWNAARDKPSSSDALGGGHAHCGALIYQGQQWPKEYHGKLLTINLHGQRVNIDRIERQGTSYLGRHEPDILQSQDLFFRGIDLSTGPDGSVYILDWSDIGECHEQTGVHRNSGRIYRVSYGRPKANPTPNLTQFTDTQLVETYFGTETWLSRQVLRVLADRYYDRSSGVKTVPVSSSTDIEELKQLWLMATLGQATHEFLQKRLDHPFDHVRVWAIRLLTETWPIDSALGRPRAEHMQVPTDLYDRFVSLANTDPSGLVRLTLASTLQRLPVNHRAKLAHALLSRSEDADDPTIPYLIWFGLIPVAEHQPDALAPLAAISTMPRVREWIARRLSELYPSDPAPLEKLLEQTRTASETIRRDVIQGMSAGFAGVRKVDPPKTWSEFKKEYSNADWNAKVQGLSVIFGDGRALDDVRRVVLDNQADLNIRKSALRTLIEANPPDLQKICESVLKTRFLNTVALKGLSRFSDPAIAKLIATNYRAFHHSERSAVIEALASRPEFAEELLNLLANGSIARSDLSAFQARQIHSFGNEKLTKRLKELWGEFRDSPQEKADLIHKLKTELTPEAIADADKVAGRAVFAKNCATCHRLFGEGKEIGPDLTGAQRKDLDYLLSNIIDPSAVVTKDFQMTVFVLYDGRIVNGIVVVETPTAVTVQTEKERLVLPLAEIETRKQSPLSLMPDGLMQSLQPHEIRDLIAYLMSDTQVALPPTNE